jgi:hypothetical protein
MKRARVPTTVAAASVVVEEADRVEAATAASVAVAADTDGSSSIGRTVFFNTPSASSFTITSSHKMKSFQNDAHHDCAPGWIDALLERVNKGND